MYIYIYIHIYCFVWKIPTYTWVRTSLPSRVSHYPVYWGLFLGILPVFHGMTFRVLNTAQICVNQHKTSKFLPETRWKINKKSANSRSIFDRYFNPLVFWYQWEYHGISTFTSKEVVIFCRVSGRLAMNLAMNLVQWLADWQTYRFQPFFLALAHHDDWEFPPLRVVETRLQVEHRRRAGNVGHSRSDRSTALNPDRRKPSENDQRCLFPGTLTVIIIMSI